MVCYAALHLAVSLTNEYKFLEAKEKSLEKDAQLYEMMLKNIKRTSRYYYKVILGSTKNSARLELVKEMLKILNN